MAALGRDDRGHAAAAQRLAQPLVRRDFFDLRLVQPARRIDDEAAALQRMMADRDLDLLGENRPDQRARKLRGMDFLVLRHQGVAGERVVMLPAGQRADAPGRGIHHLQPGAIALAPDHALMEGRRELAALQLERAVGIENQLGVVERAVVALIDAQHDDHAVPPRRRGDRLRHRARHRDRMLIEPEMLGPGEHRRMDEGKIRIPGNEGLREYREFYAFLPGLRDRGQNALKRSGRGFEVGRDLHRRDPDRFWPGHGLFLHAHHAALKRPGVENDGVGLAVQQHDVEHVERADRDDAFDQRTLAMAVQRLERETARIDLAAFRDELRDLVVEILMARKRLVAELGKAALDAERDAGAIKQDRRLKALALQPRRLQQVHEPDGAFESHGMEGDERFFSRLRLHILENLLFVINQKITLFMGRRGHSWHDCSSF